MLDYFSLNQDSYNYDFWSKEAAFLYYFVIFQYKANIFI